MALPIVKSEFSAEAILILAPTGQDARLIYDVLRKEKLEAAIFRDAKELTERVKTDFGAVIVAEEALNRETLRAFNEFLNNQDPWSDCPLIVMTTGGETTLTSLRITKELSTAGNVTLLERPFRPITLLSTVQVALRARRRQYEVRELLLKQLAATQMRDEFISVASHELKTPLTSLKLQTQLNMRLIQKTGGVPNNEYVYKLVENTGRQVDRLARLVEDMLDVSRINTGKLKLSVSEVSLGSLIHEIAERISPQLTAAKSTLTIGPVPEMKGIWDRYRIEQVIINLLSNSMRYAPGKPILLSVKKEDEYAVLSVKDDGPGIEPENQDKIFRRFERATSSRNIDGLGLGLYICKQITESHRGDIRVESTPGAGATFIVKLPLSPAYH